MINLKKNKTMIIISLIILVNALGYGIIIPVMYSYTHQYGLSDLQAGLLFAFFSLCQFFSTPLIGRLSDHFGRRPLLILSLFGSSVSFFLFAFAWNPIILFLARGLDGLTAGNLPVATATIADTLEGKDRLRGFGMVGASFGFGFIFGPALSGFSLHYGMNMPFILAGFISLFATIITVLFLPETCKNKKNSIEFSQMLQDLNPKTYIKALSHRHRGNMFLLSLVYMTSFAIYMFSFQSFMVKTLRMDEKFIAILFTIIGFTGVIMQAFIIPKIKKHVIEKDIIISTFFTLTFLFASMFFVRDYFVFIPLAISISAFNSFVQPIIQTFISRATAQSEYGVVMGLNASFNSLGMIIGPIIAGIIVNNFSPKMSFIACSIVVMICFFIARQYREVI